MKSGNWNLIKLIIILQEKKVLKIFNSYFPLIFSIVENVWIPLFLYALVFSLSIFTFLHFFVWLWNCLFHNRILLKEKKSATPILFWTIDFSIKCWTLSLFQTRHLFVTHYTSFMKYGVCHIPKYSQTVFIGNYKKNRDLDSCTSLCL